MVNKVWLLFLTSDYTNITTVKVLLHCPQDIVTKRARTTIDKSTKIQWK